jgi:hypothetical protein
MGAMAKGPSGAATEGRRTTAMATAGTNVVARQSFSIPATRFGTKDLWVVTVQRGGAHETYAGDVDLLAVERVYLPLVMR